MMPNDLLPPLHPGEVLLEEFMVPFKLLPNALARALNLTSTQISEIVKRKIHQR